MSVHGDENFDPDVVRIYPDSESSVGRRVTLLIATLSVTAIAAALFCVIGSQLVWTGHVSRSTSTTTNLINHFDESDG